MHLKTKIEELIEINENGNKTFLLFKNNQWLNISQNEYNKILEGENNDNIQ